MVLDEWTQERVALKFNPKVARLVWWVTKPPVSEYDGDKEARNRAYHLKLGRARREPIIIKLADRLHNNLTMWGVDETKQRRKVRETQDFYLPLAERHTILIHETEDVIEEIMTSWNNAS